MKRGTRTVFIVGAGASVEAGLPTNEELKLKIAELLDIRFKEFGSTQISGSHDIVASMREKVKMEGKTDITQYVHSALQIRDALPRLAISIDNFLHSHHEDKEIELCGKLGIVTSILDAERESIFRLDSASRSPDRYDLNMAKPNWYEYFFRMLNEDVKSQDIETIFDNVTFIVFNYDRCVEHFLVQALSDYYRITMAEAEKIVRKIHIYHPYGVVGYLPWQEKSPSVPYGSDKGENLILAEQIKTFTEGMADKEMIAPIHSAISEAETIVFLGFAFHPINMKLLKPNDQPTKVTRIFATTFGLSKADEAIVKIAIYTTLNLDKRLGASKGNIKIGLDNIRCVEFFQQYFRSLSATANELA
ncbi:MAG: hypothetical protein JNK24_00980 [Alphaproteobacteria bacterium]|nr:hypothetical protein [Alphaproteobacteria bacterium]